MAADDPVQIPISASEVEFHEATPAQRAESWRLNGASWAALLSIDDYMCREKQLGETDFTASGLNRYWVLTRIADPTEVVASCETTQKTAYCGGLGGYREVRAYAIASVYTNPKYRRNGMAVLLLTQLKRWMDGDGESECSALYSDIGKEYYTKLGWLVYPSQQITIAFTGAVSPSRFSTAGTRPLKNDDLPRLCDQDTASLKKRLQAMDATESRHFAFEPSHAQAHWHFVREEFVSQKLFRRVPEIKGAITDDGLSWTYWDRNFGEKKMNVQRIVRPERATHDAESTLKSAVALLETAVAQAAAWELRKVVVWNPDDLIARAAEALGAAHPHGLVVTLEERTDGSIPSLRWKGDESLEKVVWDQNEYYGWC